MNPIEVRCKGCNRWLATVSVMVGAIKCPRCKMIFEYKVISSLHVTDQYDMIMPEPIEVTRHNADISVKR